MPGCKRFGSVMLDASLFLMLSPLASMQVKRWGSMRQNVFYAWFSAVSFIARRNARLRRCVNLAFISISPRFYTLNWHIKGRLSFKRKNARYLFITSQTAKF